jgi:hypothetical protein
MKAQKPPQPLNEEEKKDESSHDQFYSLDD